MGHGRPGTSRVTGTRATVSPRLVLGSPRGALRGRTWARLHQVPTDPGDAGPAESPAPRRTYRSLISRGLSPDEAATLTAYLAGIPIDEAHWSLRQVNELLFLRELQRTGRFGPTDGRTHRTP